MVRKQISFNKHCSEKQLRYPVLTLMASGDQFWTFFISHKATQAEEKAILAFLVADPISELYYESSSRHRCYRNVGKHCNAKQLITGGRGRGRSVHSSSCGPITTALDTTAPSPSTVKCSTVRPTAGSTAPLPHFLRPVWPAPGCSVSPGPGHRLGTPAPPHSHSSPLLT